MNRPSRTPFAALLVLVTGFASFALLLGAPSRAVVTTAPDRTDRTDRTDRGALVYPVLDRRFETSKAEVLGGRGRFGRVVTGTLPRGIRVERGLLVGRAKRSGLVTVGIVVKAPDRTVVRQLTFRVLRPSAARPGTRLVTRSRGVVTGGSTDVDVSADGGVVTFTSGDDGLVAGDDNGLVDVFAWSRDTGEVSLVSHAVDGGSGDRRSADASVSADGRYVAFWSESTDLTSGPVRAASEVYVRDRTTDALVTVSLGAGRSDSWSDPQVLNDGSVVFGGGYDTTGALLEWRWDRATALVTRIAAPTERDPVLAGASGDGRWLAWRDGSTVLVTDAATGAEAGRCDSQYFDSLSDATFSADGSRMVVDGFGLAAGSGVGGARVGLHLDTRTGRCGVSHGAVGMTADGATVAETSFLRRPLQYTYRDVLVGAYPRASRSVFRHATATTSADVAISADGSTVVYVSDANNVLDADRDRALDVFVWDRRAR